MLKAEIELKELRHDVAWFNERVVIGKSWIEIYQHEALEASLIKTDGQWFFIVRERMNENGKCKALPKNQVVDFESYVSLFQECLAWPLDYIIIEVVKDACRMRIRSGVLGTAPVYFRAQDDTVKLSWEFADFLHLHFAIDNEIVAHRLALATFYTARTICAGIFL
ncbi:MAG: hypothetical protein EOO38_09395, partial [Cytophagaceae bacterium]